MITEIRLFLIFGARRLLAERTTQILNESGEMTSCRSLSAGIRRKLDCLSLIDFVFGFLDLSLQTYNRAFGGEKQQCLQVIQDCTGLYQTGEGKVLPY